MSGSKPTATTVWVGREGEGEGQVAMRIESMVHSNRIYSGKVTTATDVFETVESRLWVRPEGAIPRRHLRLTGVLPTLIALPQTLIVPLLPHPLKIPSGSSSIPASHYLLRLFSSCSGLECLFRNTSSSRFSVPSITYKLVRTRVPH
ncbi:hypothetical protein E2C01_008766 [Portunus trituberculatus]|uniref:Uncharacterized protein n=1 Tax=Portunus trituberculatus TaxID=210409 RepID=A0A5B7D2P8_PORTR|nr:hypothetical protein [Portunus trituberculatus]